MDGIEIRKITRAGDIPLELLLLADPSEKCIEDYIGRGEAFGAFTESLIVGVYVLIRTRPLTVELVNIAVDEKYQGGGIGKRLVADAAKRAGAMGAKVLEVGTGNSSISQLAFYQRCGFRITGVDRDFFRIHGSGNIVENGIECIDMVRLSMLL